MPVLLFTGFSAGAQQVLPATKAVLDQVEELQLRNKPEEALKVLDTSIKTTSSPADLAYLYAYKSSFYTFSDSLLQAKQLVDLSMENARKSENNLSLAVAYRAGAYLNSIMNMPDAVVKNALAGLKYAEHSDEDPATKYHLNYLLYGAYSRWDEGDKMEKYIRKARDYAIKAKSINLQVNVNNGISSMYLAHYKRDREKSLLDSSYHYLNQSFALLEKHPGKVSGNTFVITCINLANYYLDHASGDLEAREEKAFDYLKLTEEKLKNKEASSEKWINVFGIKSGFAKQKGDLALAEQYLLQGLALLVNDDTNHYRLEYAVNKDLTDIALKEGNPGLAVNYQQNAENALKKSFNEQQLFNAQKLEVQYETRKKDQELKLLKEREDFSRKQNYLYGGIALASLFGLVFMFVSYHFRLRYSIEREKKLAREKEDARQQAQIQLKLEKEEQARLKAEQELLDLRRQQLEKEALANSLIIERKNDTLRQIQDKIQSGEAGHIQKLIKEEMLMQADFEDIRMQIQELHPDFFNRLSEKAIQKLTPLDLKYCTYLYLKMDTRQIAQVLHVEPQSVRMFKYRLKQKFGLGKDVGLEEFLRTY
ncbi:hypothetical protein DN748_11255 [Sinomicrobium soli]|nr:hypothetical protein DN748_11255 [Sinomicrobium sp. N-1-3-6]